ncbi:putative mitochondrial protein AtMg01250 [Silene latifolia]|uniref:putative mitochondrial protein AtMg01250 n=1 Tax=Silene latifolia TaxID=37657 RepID=UPI003D77D614
MLQGLKFPSHFIQLVMQCVRSTSFTLSLNGSNFGYFKGQRGLRQGDPISPLLFTICMEYLSRLIKFANDRWPFQYHPLCKNLKLTHLMFADDLLLFCKGKSQSIWLLMRAFSSFSKASGLAMNNAKSEIFFNGVAEDIKEGIKMVTGFKEGTMPFRYLGVPIKAGRLTKSECKVLL